MRLLLDTHTLIWWVLEPDKLSKRIDRLLQDADTDVYVSALTAWEIAIKVELGKLAFDATYLDEFDHRMNEMSWMTLPILPAHGIAAARLPGPHKDPFDRMLVAQALSEGLAIASLDQKLVALGANLIW